MSATSTPAGRVQSPGADSSLPQGTAEATTAEVLILEGPEEDGPSGSTRGGAGPAEEDLRLDKQGLCLDILVNGNVNSFVDFFYLTHRSEDDITKQQRAEIPVHEMPQVKTWLTTAESAHRRADPGPVLDSYNCLASYFADLADQTTAIYFFQRALEVAEAVDDKPHQGNALRHLGQTYDKLADLPKAIEFHERHLAIARELGDQERIKAASQELFDVYRRYAEEHEKKGDNAGAIKYYESSLAAAKEAEDKKAEGIATYRLGEACFRAGKPAPTAGTDAEAAPASRSLVAITTTDPSGSTAVVSSPASGPAGSPAVPALSPEAAAQAIAQHERYLQLCKETGDQVGEGHAYAALARCFEGQGDTRLALVYLERYLQCAEATGQKQAQAEACSSLGQIYNAQGNYSRAVAYFEKTFEIARKLGDRKLLDQARVNLGMANGNLALTPYMEVVTTDLPALLKWKTRRVNFKSASAAANERKGA